eukprot:m.984271 g.984271  ORF g.984271 m.984271 type:complete len:1022 (-) comp23977_c1_seq1:226-3291(-)
MNGEQLINMKRLARPLLDCRPEWHDSDASMRIVGIVANSSDDFQSTTMALNDMIGADVFDTSPAYYSNDGIDVDCQCYLDKESSCFYITVLSRFEDLETIADRAEMEADQCIETHHAWLEAFDDKLFRTLLFLFTSCHEVVIATPKARLDIGWLTTLRRMEQARPSVVAASGTHTEKKATSLFPGMFVPNLSFLYCYPNAFFQAVVTKCKDFTTSTESGRKPSQGDVPSELVRKFHANAEWTTRRVLRRARLHSIDENIDRRVQHKHNAAAASATKLFRVLPEKVRPLTHFVDVPGMYTGNSANPANILLMANTTLATALHGGEQQPPVAHTARAPHMQDLVRTLGLPRREKADTVPVGPWLARATAMFSALVEQSSVATMSPGSMVPDGVFPPGCFAHTAPVDRFRLFSGAMCEKALPHAMELYNRGLPPHYRRSVHDAALATATARLHQTACGPALPEYIRVLQRRCTALWVGGRQQCERTSVLGFPCLHVLGPPATSPQGDKVDIRRPNDAAPNDAGDASVAADGAPGDDDIALGPTKAADRTTADGVSDDVITEATGVHDEPCASGCVLRCACACGRHQDAVADPFAVADLARFHFRGPCCRSLAASRRWSATMPTRHAPRDGDQRRPPETLSGTGNARGAEGDELLPEAEKHPRVASPAVEDDERDVVEVLLHGRGNVDARDTGLATPTGGDDGVTSLGKAGSETPRESTTAEPCFTLTTLGSGSAYSATRGLQGPGFNMGSAESGGTGRAGGASWSAVLASTKSHLLPLAVPPSQRRSHGNASPTPSATLLVDPTTPPAKTPPATAKNPWGKPSKVIPTQPSPVESALGESADRPAAGYYGYEYECTHGSRFIWRPETATKRGQAKEGADGTTGTGKHEGGPSAGGKGGGGRHRNPARAGSSTDGDAAVPSVPGELRMVDECTDAACTQRHSARHHTQLTRIYVVTPDARWKIRVNPKVMIPADETNSNRMYGCGNELDLQPSTFYVLQLPRVLEPEHGIPFTAIVHVAVDVCAM